MTSNAHPINRMQIRRGVIVRVRLLGQICTFTQAPTVTHGFTQFRGQSRHCNASKIEVMTMVFGLSTLRCNDGMDHSFEGMLSQHYVCIQIRIYVYTFACQVIHSLTL